MRLVALGAAALLLAGCKSAVQTGESPTLTPQRGFAACPQQLIGQLPAEVKALLSPENKTLTALQRLSLAHLLDAPKELPPNVHPLRCLLPGDRIYLYDTTVIRNGRTATLVNEDDTITRELNGRIVLRDSSGNIIDTYPPSAIIDTKGGSGIQVLQPGQRVPKWLQGVAPNVVIK